MTHMRLPGWLRQIWDKAETLPEVGDRLAALERDMKAIKLEWEDTYESVMRAVRKLGKRQQRALQEEGEEPNAKEETPPPNGDLSALRAQARARGWRV